jgi:hypothetical protein
MAVVWWSIATVCFSIALLILQRQAMMRIIQKERIKVEKTFIRTPFRG